MKNLVALRHLAFLPRLRPLSRHCRPSALWLLTLRMVRRLQMKVVFLAWPRPTASGRVQVAAFKES